MPKDFLAGIKDEYDVVVVGSGLAGLTAANILGRAGRSVLLVEQHYKLGGMATWFKRPGGHIFDVSLHGFPVGMVKSCKRYWTPEIADSIVQLKHIRFDNPMFSLTTTFNREDFTKLLVEKFQVPPATVAEFFDTTIGRYNLLGTWGNSIGHGRTAAVNMLGQRTAYEDIPMYSSTLFDSYIRVIGLTPETGNDLESFEHMNAQDRSYQRLFFLDGRCVGACLIGDMRFRQRIFAAIKSREQIPVEDRRKLLA